MPLKVVVCCRRRCCCCCLRRGGRRVQQRRRRPIRRSDWGVAQPMRRTVRSVERRTVWRERQAKNKQVIMSVHNIAEAEEGAMSVARFLRMRKHPSGSKKRTKSCVDQDTEPARTGPHQRRTDPPTYKLQSSDAMVAAAPPWCRPQAGGGSMQVAPGKRLRRQSRLADNRETTRAQEGGGGSGRQTLRRALDRGPVGIALRTG